MCFVLAYVSLRRERMISWLWEGRWEREKNAVYRAINIVVKIERTLCIFNDHMSVWCISYTKIHLKCVQLLLRSSTKR